MDRLREAADQVIERAAGQREHQVWEAFIRLFADKLDEMDTRLQEIQEKVNEMWDERETQ